MPQGQNVIRKAIADTKAADDERYLAARARQHFQTHWYDNLDSNTRAKQAKQRQNQISSEITAANAENKAIRRQRLRAFLEEEHQMHIAELTRRGLTIFTPY